MSQDQQHTHNTRSQYFELSKNTIVQYVIFAVLCLTFISSVHLFIGIPLMESFFVSFMHADVNYDGSILEYRIAEGAPKENITTNMLTQWGIIERSSADFIQGKKLVARYLFNPTLALFPLILFIGIALGAYIVAFLPKSVGLIRQKISREIMNALDNIALSLYGEHTDAEIEDIRNRILGADIRDVHDLANEYQITVGQVVNLQDALFWQESSNMFESFLRTQSGIRFYMRSYFTSQYGNTILGLVYIGAAVLIIIIGIRGLKFIPSSEPSIILFALGLEFILLIVYAVTLMLSPNEDTIESYGSGTNESSGLLSIMGNNNESNSGMKAKEVESLLKVFITQFPDSKK
jgi:hypothetical protein